MQGFALAEQRELERLSATGPDRSWSVRVALSLIDAAYEVAGNGEDVGASRAEQDAFARAVWLRIKSPRR